MGKKHNGGSSSSSSQYMSKWFYVAYILTAAVGL